MLDGNPQKGNKHAERYIAAFKALATHGDIGRAALAKLLSDERKEVRVTTAAFLLRYRHHEAKAVLKEAAKGDDLVSFGAQQALERWKDGTWELDPE